MPPSTPAAAASAPSPAKQARSEESEERFQDSALAREVAFLTARARGRGNALANQLLADLDLKVRHFSVLAMACSGTNPSQRELGGFLDLDPSQVVALVDILEDRGAIRREPDPRDRRSKILVATEAGHELYAQAAQRTREAEEQTLQALSPAERDQLRVLLAKIVF
ncbi:MarR family winged helix-turn-helix transcriptional regulator [Nesterenkonia sp. LB17]|uniref:MarR family winged helix-turn-helix transcriptional regulator n=1 Tax=unclassified Nesterenkonia TaxID=2629769 RepID=UPI001F4C9649|nr:MULTISPECIES: MarR family winged helix-turn-helix transcriptional regulator [unclassified Nesterenkonia]MCH8565631.1 MarR family winged helix-turn-helix transcriptional regulator [Nesterenkonia sp. LB17]MCH8571717.1 MarR family winged helix-turn-helix transcriptional regulator [Nesterenkonia sp. AY15]